MDPFAKFDEVSAFRDTLNSESDRGCALMAAAYVDEQLKLLLGRILVPHEKLQRKIFEPSGVLGTFSSRIDFAYLLGQIGPKAHRDLHLIREMRNAFGHSAKPLSFQDQSIADRCKELYHDVGEEELPPRKKFTRVVLGVLGPIHARFAVAVAPSEGADVPITPEATAAFRAWKKAVFDTLNPRSNNNA